MTFDEELIAAARRLLKRRVGQKGKLPSARVRRSISTAHYALFHFLVEESSRTIVGSHNDLRRRRRTLARAFSHAGLKTALEKVRGRHVDASASELLRPRGITTGVVTVPTYLRETASAFFDAQSKRHDADYDLNKSASELDARLLIARVRRAASAWRAANTTADKDFKHALAILMLLKGQIRREN